MESHELSFSPEGASSDDEIPGGTGNITTRSENTIDPQIMQASSSFGMDAMSQIKIIHNPHRPRSWRSSNSSFENRDRATFVIRNDFRIRPETLPQRCDQGIQCLAPGHVATKKDDTRRLVAFNPDTLLLRQHRTDKPHNKCPTNGFGGHGRHADSKEVSG
jgi:hypothetical protein